jgi:hypothetical protein
MSYRIPGALIGEENMRIAPAQAEDYAALGRRLERAGVDIEIITAKVAAFAVAIPTWGSAQGARALRAFRASASRVEFLTSSRIARPFINSRARRRPARRISRGIRSTIIASGPNSPRRSASASTRSIPTPFRIRTARHSPISSARSPTARRPCAIRRSRTMSSASRSATS